MTLRNSPDLGNETVHVHCPAPSIKTITRLPDTAEKKVNWLLCRISQTILDLIISMMKMNTLQLVGYPVYCQDYTKHCNCHLQVDIFPRRRQYNDRFWWIFFSWLSQSVTAIKLSRLTRRCGGEFSCQSLSLLIIFPRLVFSQARSGRHQSVIILW